MKLTESRLRQIIAEELANVPFPWDAPEEVTWIVSKQDDEDRDDENLEDIEHIDDLGEAAPPGREKQVKALKDVSGVEKPYAVAWASYKKSQMKNESALREDGPYSHGDTPEQQQQALDVEAMIDQCILDHLPVGWDEREFAQFVIEHLAYKFDIG